MNMKDILSNRKGFTIVELVVAIAIVAAIMAPAAKMSIQGITSFYREQEKIELMESGQLALSRISKQIRISDQELEVDIENESLRVISSVGDFTYSLNSNKQLLEGSNAIAENVALFDVDLSDSGNLLKIDLKLLGPKYGQTIDLKTSLYLRNQ